MLSIDKINIYAISFELVGSREGAAVLLDDLARKPNACLYGSLELLALDDLRYKATDERVSSTVSIDDEIFLNSRDGELLLNSVLSFLRNCHKYGVLALSDDGHTGSAFVDLVPLGDGNSHILEGGEGDLVGLSEALRFILITENVVSMLEDLVHLSSVELYEEASGKVVT